VEPGNTRLSGPARRSLRRLGLLDGVWQKRLAGSNPELSRFINRFHRVAGVGRVVEDYFVGHYQRAVARMAMRLSLRLTSGATDFERNLHFDRRITFAPGGDSILVVVVGYKGLHYRLFPWRRLHNRALRRQLRRDRLTFHSPDKIRWVFDRRGRGSVQSLRNELRRSLGDSSGQAERRWGDTLARTALLI
jgi:hypothetical protein